MILFDFLRLRGLIFMEKSAFVIVDTKIHDSDAYEEYKKAAKPILEKFGGVYLTRGGFMDTIQSELWEPTRIVLIQFPSVKKAKEAIESVEYTSVKKIRLENADSTFVILEGS